MNVVENIAFALRVKGVSKMERSEQASGWLNKIGLQGYEKKKVDEISGGEGQRVQLARTLIAGFPILLLDEPFSALDVDLKNDLRVLLKKLVEETGVACLLVSHDPEDIERLADTYSEIQNGAIGKTVKTCHP